MKIILGRKLGMTQIVEDNGVLTAVTLIKAEPCVLTQIKTVEKDGYNALQFSMPNGKVVSKSVKGHVQKADKNLIPRMIKELRVDQINDEEHKLGSSFDVSNFAVGDKVKVTGKSKGKGFAGTVKRHNFATSAESHGGNGMVRRPGSIGSMYPQKIFKGKKMAGQMGNEQVTVSGLSVAFIDESNNLIGFKGAIPGPRKGLVKVVGI